MADGKNPPSQPGLFQRLQGMLRRQRNRTWRSSRNRFTRESMKDSLKTFAWVAPLTLLIWVYAERKQVETLSDQTIPIRIVSANPTRTARLVGQDANITAELRGSRTALENFKRELSSSDGPRRVTLEVSADRIGNEIREDAARLLADSPAFKDNLIEVTGVSPNTLVIAIDDLVQREIQVRAPLNVTNLVTAPEFSPAKVNFVGPASVLRRAADTQANYVEADLSGYAELKSPGTHVLKSVALRNPWEDEGVTLNPDRVDVTLTVRQADETYEIQSLSVFVTMPQTFQGRYRIEYPATIARIRISGPGEVIRAIENDTIRPKARLEVSLEDLPVGKPHSRQLQFDLPEGVHVISDPAQTTINFTIQEIRAGE